MTTFSSTPQDEPILSINIPTFNRSKYLGPLLRSLVQDILEFSLRIQINVLDNCSVDDTEHVVKTISLDYPISYYKNHQNIGPQSNIRNAHYLGNSAYVWVLCDDDIICPGALSSIVNYLEQRFDILLLTYQQVTPVSGHVISVSCSTSKRCLGNQNPNSIVSNVDKYIGFLSANIIRRSWILFYSPHEYDLLDAEGEIAHSIIYYNALSMGASFHVLDGCFLLQTVDNSYLNHSSWMYVCAKYCVQLRANIRGLGLFSAHVSFFFIRRLLVESIRRVLSEKYRSNPIRPLLWNPFLAKHLGISYFLVQLACLLPSCPIRFFHDLFYPRRS